jgi:hypothetical protein
MANIIYCEKRCDEDMSNAILTTRQMIDKLEVGEVAEGSFGDFMLYVTKVKSGCFYQCSDGTGEKFDKPFTVFAGVTEVKWHIIPKYVLFSEAMKAIEKGKNVNCDFKGEKISIKSWSNKVGTICQGKACTSGGGAAILIAWIVAGKWSIEE